MPPQNDAPHAGERATGATDADRVGTLTRLPNGERRWLGFGSLRIGRQSQADIVLTHETVSRHHADICYESGRYVLYDHSTNGTWANGELVAVARTLRDGDRLRFGEVEFLFSLEPREAKAGQRPRPPSGRDARDATTRVMKEGKARGRRGRGRRWIWLAALLVLLVAAAAVYILFPGLLQGIL